MIHELLMPITRPDKCLLGLPGVIAYPIEYTPCHVLPTALSRSHLLSTYLKEDKSKVKSKFYM